MVEEIDTNLSSLWRALDEVKDPEIPSVSVLEMGMIEAVQLLPDGTVRVDLLPTFSGCPAIHVMREDIAARLGALPGVRAVEVRVCHEPLWTSDRITPEGQEKLRGFGIAPPAPSRGRSLTVLTALPVACPFCGSLDTARDSLFGPTPCRSVYRCRQCRNPFERFKAI